MDGSKTMTQTAGWVVLLVAAVTSSALAAPAAPLTKDECAMLARTIGPATASIESMVRAVATVQYKPIINRAPNAETRSALVSAEATQTAMEKALRAYMQSLQDLTYQFQRCGR